MKERRTRKIIYSLSHSVASELWTDCSLEAETERESKKVAGRTGGEEREAHILLAHGSILCEKGESTFA